MSILVGLFLLPFLNSPSSRQIEYYHSLSNLPPLPFFLSKKSNLTFISRGPSKVAIYNAEFVPLAGKTHPRLMGATFEEGFPEIWNLVKPVFDGAARDGVSHDVKEMLMFVERKGFTEETYFNGNFTPVRDESGQVAGFYNAVHEEEGDVAEDADSCFVGFGELCGRFAVHLLTLSAEKIGGPCDDTTGSKPVRYPYGTTL
jgi:hypothetical protein